MWDEQLGPFDLHGPVRVVVLDDGPYVQQLVAAVGADPQAEASGVLAGITSPGSQHQHFAIAVEDAEGAPGPRPYLEQLFARQPDLRLPPGRELLDAPGRWETQRDDGWDVKITKETSVALADDTLSITRVRAVRVGSDDRVMRSSVELELVDGDVDALRAFASRHEQKTVRVLAADHVGQTMGTSGLLGPRLRVYSTLEYVDSAPEVYRRLFESLTGRAMKPLPEG